MAIKRSFKSVFISKFLSSIKNIKLKKVYISEERFLLAGICCSKFAFIN